MYVCVCVCVCDRENESERSLITPSSRFLSLPGAMRLVRDLQQRRALPLCVRERVRTNQCECVCVREQLRVCVRDRATERDCVRKRLTACKKESE